QNGRDCVGASTKEKGNLIEGFEPRKEAYLPSPAFSVARPLPRASAAFLTSSISTASPFPFFFLLPPTAFITRCR
ncbi:unnamed protein product, partial [Musa textilis]